ncbi:MAG: chemotaxis protein CheX [Acidobacteria bacterium]|nr:chemotaxis protein CheX [Acidobacteriota bacterium]
MNNQKTVELIQHSTCEVLSMMLGVQAEAGEPYEESGTTETFSGIVSLVSVSGDWAGMGSIYCGTELALKLTGMMLLDDQVSTVNDDVLDAMAELGNMIVGNVKTMLEAELGPLALSIPTVICGRNYRALNGIGKTRIVVPFEVAGGTMIVKFYILPQASANRLRQAGVVQNVA